jgi:hypothetical protein
MAVCPNCGTPIPAKAGYCTECGQTVVAPKTYTPTPVPARSHRKLILILSLSLALVAAALGVLFLTGVLGKATAPEGTYTGRYPDGDVLSVVTFYDDGTFSEEFEGEHWYGTWVMDQNKRVTCTYGDDGSRDVYVWNAEDDTLDWQGEGRVLYSK